VTEIRAARRADIERLREIEIAAGRAFIDIGMPEIAGDEPASAEVMATYIDDDRAWVAVDANDVAVAYVFALVIDGQGHLEQVSVHPDAAGQRVGRRLIDEVATWARGREMTALTLLTFRDVPWNAPYYERCGFRILAGEELGPELVALRHHEAEIGLDISVRVAMRRDL
jgi:GNAT superfamily N-acetyltransferase